MEDVTVVVCLLPFDKHIQNKQSQIDGSGTDAVPGLISASYSVLIHTTQRGAVGEFTHPVLLLPAAGRTVV